MNSKIAALTVLCALALPAGCGNVPHDNPMDPNYQYRVQPCSAPPVVSSLTPSSGSSSGGTTVTISGSNLSAVSAVSFGDTVGSITTRTETEVKVITPSHAAGSVTVSISNPCGSASSPPSFTFN